MRKLKLVNQYYMILLGNDNLDTEIVNSCSMIHKKSQTYIMCLILSCSQGLPQRKFAKCVTRDLIRYGGEHHYNYSKTGKFT